jgi:hypothetical protein
VWRRVAKDFGQILFDSPLRKFPREDVKIVTITKRGITLPFFAYKLQTFDFSKVKLKAIHSSKMVAFVGSTPPTH